MNKSFRIQVNAEVERFVRELAKKERRSCGKQAEILFERSVLALIKATPASVPAVLRPESAQTAPKPAPVASVCSIAGPVPWPEYAPDGRAFDLNPVRVEYRRTIWRRLGLEGAEGPLPLVWHPDEKAHYLLHDADKPENFLKGKL